MTSENFLKVQKHEKYFLESRIQNFPLRVLMILKDFLHEIIVGDIAFCHIQTVKMFIYPCMYIRINISCFISFTFRKTVL